MGFTDEERAAVKARAQELKTEARVSKDREEGEKAVLAAIAALNGDDITIYGDGSQTRSFCYVDDLVGGLVSLMDSAPDFTGPVNGPPSVVPPVPPAPPFDVPPVPAGTPTLMLGPP